MDLSVAKQDGIVVLSARGDVDLETADQLAAIGILVLQEPTTRRLVIDLADVGFVDSFGLGVLVQLRQNATDGGADLALRSPQPQMERILKVTDLGSLFEIEV